MDRCRLQSTLGRDEECPRDPCPFWEPGGAVLEGRCALEQVDLGENADFAAWLLRIRKRLEAARRAAGPP